MKTDIDIFIVTYKPDTELIGKQLKSIASQYSDYTFNLFIWDNTGDDLTVQTLKTLCKEYENAFSSSQVLKGEENIGFGPGHNRLMAVSSSPRTLILNQEVILEPGCINNLMSFAVNDDKGCAWELRQIPYEHPKIYDPVTLETPWISCAACLFRRKSIDRVNGFDPCIFMYGEDVDLSWRLRSKGWKLRYLPNSAIVHNTYNYAGEIKPLQAISGTLTNLCLRARFGTWKDILTGLVMLACEIAMPESFPSRRKLLMGVLSSFFKKFHYFRYKNKFSRENFKPSFIGWNYSIHREGAFYQFNPRGKNTVYPLVSILVRTCNRKDWLRETLLSVKHQTYPNIEVIVVEDGPPLSEKMVLEEFMPIMNLQYHATHVKVGRSKAGNVALGMANGEWMNFLDDDDILFADHTEVLIQAALEHNVQGVYGLAWETGTRVISENPLKYEELFYIIRHRREFSRVALWHYNYIPIQSVMFNRNLYEEHGGLAEDMDQLEDWNLWTRYTLNTDFILIEKCTSKYRVPFNSRLHEARQEQLDISYKKALEKQKQMIYTSNPRTISELTEAYIRSQAMLLITRGHVRLIAEKFALTRWLMRRRGMYPNVLAFLKKRLKD
ncbi:MAG: glycosyltransferase family 2 protein [Desulfobacteraceae bacterium]|nr:glycosyltransferase family 2 protein [Desulfobacteraceae bacterium]